MNRTRQPRMSRIGHGAFAAFALLTSVLAAAAIYHLGGWKLLAIWLLW